MPCLVMIIMEYFRNLHNVYISWLIQMCVFATNTLFFGGPRNMEFREFPCILFREDIERSACCVLTYLLFEAVWNVVKYVMWNVATLWNEATLWNLVGG